jgi:hypothetical protein
MYLEKKGNTWHKKEVQKTENDDWKIKIKSESNISSHFWKICVGGGLSWGSIVLLSPA